MESLMFLAYFAAILLIGIASTLISRKIKIPNILLLIMIGMAANVINLKLGVPVELPQIFITSISILALVMIVFDASSRFKFKMFKDLSVEALSLSIIFLVMNLIFLTFFTRLIFGIESIFIALIFSALMSGTDPASVLSMFKGCKNKVVEALEVESLIHAPLVLLLPFILINVMKSSYFSISVLFKQEAMVVLYQILFGIGIGIVVGMIAIKMMRKQYVEILSPLGIMAAALIGYVSSELIGGNGVLAVTVIGLMFGNLYLNHRNKMHEFSSIFANSLEIIVFFLLGFMIYIDINSAFLIKSLLLFFIYLLIRFVSVQFSFKSSSHTFKEKLFMVFNMQKGILVATVAFTLLTYSMSKEVKFIQLIGAAEMLNLILVFTIYSIIISTIITRYSKFFIKADVKC